MRAHADAGIAVGLWFVLALAAPDLVGAQTESPPIRFDVQVVHGSNQITPARLDPECEEIRKRLPMQFSYLEMLKRESLTLSFGEQGRLALPTGHPINLLPISIVRDRLHLQFQMENVVDTRLQMRSGRPVIFGGGMYKRGQIIIMVTPDFRAHLKGRSPASPRGPRLHRVRGQQ